MITLLILNLHVSITEFYYTPDIIIDRQFETDKHVRYILIVLIDTFIFHS